MYKKVITPLNDDAVHSLKAGDRVLITGKIYTARDAAHKRMIEALNAGQELPFNPEGQIVYYAGPCPPKPGNVAGPIGPTTSGRMDKYAPALMKQGLKGMIGKGDRADSVIEAMSMHKCVYFAAIGGLGAYISTIIKSQKVVAYEDLGAEAVMELWVENFPATVVIDCECNNIYRTEPDKYKNKFSLELLDR